jgi:beta-glucosidase
LAVGATKVVRRVPGATPKHYAGNNQETNLTTINDIIDERTLREIYLPAFEATVKQARVGAVMCAENQINGSHIAKTVSC